MPSEIDPKGDALDRFVAECRSIKAAVGGFEVIPGSFGYAPTGVGPVKWNMVKAVKNSWSLPLAGHEGQRESRLLRTSGAWPRRTKSLIATTFRASRLAANKQGLTRHPSGRTPSVQGAAGLVAAL